MPSSKHDLLPAHKIFKDCKPGIRYYKLLKLLPDLPFSVANRPYIDEMDRIMTRMIDICTKANQLEGQGEMEAAAALFAQLVDDQYDDPHPYFRLCDHYEKAQQPEQTIRVCIAYIEMAQTLSAMELGHPYRDELVETFTEKWLRSPQISK